MRQAILVLCAGDTSLHQQSKCNWAHPKRKYDIAILYYGDDPKKKREYKAESDFFHCQKGPKWTLVRDFLLANKQLCEQYAFVAFPDDDLRVTPDQWNELFDVGKTYGLDLFQPSLENNGPAYVKHTHLVTHPQNILRYTTFVEIMTPVFSQRALVRAVRVLTDSHIRSGWGVDYVLPRAVLPHHRYDQPDQHPTNRHTYQIAVVDSVSITHTKPLGNTKHAAQSTFYKTYNINPEAEMKYFLHKYNVRSFVPQTLRCVPVPVDMRPFVTTTPANTLTPADPTRLPSYLSANVMAELEAVRKHPHQLYTKPADVQKFYHKIEFGFHVRISNNRFRIVRDFGSFESRNHNTLCMLHDVLCRYKIANTDILVSTDDFVRQPDVKGVPILCMAKRASQTYLTYPDHSFYNWQEANTRAWDTERQRIRESNERRTDHNRKIPKALFRGNVNTFYVRKYLAMQCKMHTTHKTRKTRHTRKQHQKQNQHQHQNVLDVMDVKVGQKPRRSSTRKHKHAHDSKTAFVSLADHNRWKYLLHIPGRSYAARLKYLLMSNSVVLYVRKQPQYEYNEFWYKYLQNGTNCVVIDDHNVYNHNNQMVSKRNGCWDDRANNRIASDIQQSVRALESTPKHYRAMVEANEEWRRTFDYEMVLLYFAVLLDGMGSGGTGGADGGRCKTNNNLINI